MTYCSYPHACVVISHQRFKSDLQKDLKNDSLDFWHPPCWYLSSKKGSSRSGRLWRTGGGRRQSHPVASSRQRATEESRAFRAPRALAETVVGSWSVCATTPPSTHSLTGAFFNRRRNEERASEVGAMSTPARKRLMRDFKRLQKDPPAGISGTPTEANIMVRAPAREPRRAES